MVVRSGHSDGRDDIQDGRRGVGRGGGGIVGPTGGVEDGDSRGVYR